MVDEGGRVKELVILFGNQMSEIVVANLPLSPVTPWKLCVLYLQAPSMSLNTLDLRGGIST